MHFSIEIKHDETYEGQFRNDQKNGKGKVVYVDGFEYDGEWQNDKKHGFGYYLKFNFNNFYFQSISI